MISLQIAFENRIGPALARFGDVKNQSRILNFILARVGRRYRSFIRKNYLSGQMIDGGSGPQSLSGRLVVYKGRREKNVYIIGEKGRKTGGETNLRLANIYEHAGGYTIEPKKKTTLFFVDRGGHWVFTRKPIEGRARPFMSASFASFGWTAVIDAEVESVFAAEFAKGALA